MLGAMSATHLEDVHHKVIVISMDNLAGCLLRAVCRGWARGSCCIHTTCIHTTCWLLYSFSNSTPTAFSATTICESRTSMDRHKRQHVSAQADDMLSHCWGGLRCAISCTFFSRYASIPVSSSNYHRLRPRPLKRMASPTLLSHPKPAAGLSCNGKGYLYIYKEDQRKNQGAPVLRLQICWAYSYTAFCLN